MDYRSLPAQAIKCSLSFLLPADGVSPVCFLQLPFIVLMYPVLLRPFVLHVTVVHYSHSFLMHCFWFVLSMVTRLVTLTVRVRNTNKIVSCMHTQQMLARVICFYLYGISPDLSMFIGVLQNVCQVIWLFLLTLSTESVSLHSLSVVSQAWSDEAFSMFRELAPVDRSLYMTIASKEVCSSTGPCMVSWCMSCMESAMSTSICYLLSCGHCCFSIQHCFVLVSHCWL